MTTPWSVPPLWLGKTVAVLASGASLTQELADSVRHLPCIAVRKAVRRAPWAEMLIALDGPMDAAYWEETRDFPGIRICGAEVDGLDAMYLNLRHERITLRQGHEIEVRNNGLAAIRIAAMAGAAKILLLGFDAPDESGHFHYFYSDGVDHGWPGEEYPGHTIGLNALIAELRSRGVEIEHVTGDLPEAPAPSGGQNWIIACAAYGRAYRDEFLNVTLPRMEACLDGFWPVRWMIYTDQPEEIRARLPDAQCKRVADDGNYRTFVDAFQLVWSVAEAGDVVCFLCADMIVSRGAFHFARDQIEKGYLAVVCAGLRTRQEDAPPPVGAEAGELLSFAVEHAHQIERARVFGVGRSVAPTMIFFERGNSIMLRAFHLHPFMAVKPAGAAVFRSTVDGDLLSGFDRERIYVVRNGEMAAIERSPTSKTHDEEAKAINAESIRRMSATRATPMHRWFAEHQIRIAGHGDCGDIEIMRAAGIATRT